VSACSASSASASFLHRVSQARQRLADEAGEQRVGAIVCLREQQPEVIRRAEQVELRRSAQVLQQARAACGVVERQEESDSASTRRCSTGRSAVDNDEL